MNLKRIITAAAFVGTLAVSHAALAASMDVFKTPWCGCCQAWADAFKAAGFDVAVTDMEDLSQVREQAGVPAEMEGCHSAMIEGYFLEGHVPMEAVEKLLDERPEITGLAVPGMPSGSLGMGDDLGARYDVLSVTADGATEVFMSVGG